ncbi:hypothetical protein HJC23_005168, partial [Cyclotella cryptica]
MVRFSWRPRAQLRLPSLAIYFFALLIVGRVIYDIAGIGLLSPFSGNLPHVHLQAAHHNLTATSHSDCSTGVLYRNACVSRFPVSSARRVEAVVAGIIFNMSVYSTGGEIEDIVSNNIAQHRVWEKTETEEMMGLFPCIQGAHCEEGGYFINRRGTLLDVGANIGWYSLVAAHIGHNVISFEPFSKNVDLLCSSQRDLKEDFKNNWKLFQMGLDYRKRQCQLFQVKGINFGDTHSVCDEKTRESFLINKYEPLGWMNTTTLDDALLAGVFDSYSGIDVMKIDVEGFEPSVFAGANRFFESKYAPRYIFIEFNVLPGEAGDYSKSTLIHLRNH